MTNRSKSLQSNLVLFLRQSRLPGLRFYASEISDSDFLKRGCFLTEIYLINSNKSGHVLLFG